MRWGMARRAPIVTVSARGSCELYCDACRHPADDGWFGLA